MNRTAVFIAGAGIALSIVFSPVWAARPYMTDDAGTVEVGKFELETGANFWKDMLNAGIGLKHGVTDRMDIGFSLGYNGMPEDERGVAPAQLVLKFALIPDLLAATAMGDFGDNGYGINLIASKSFGPIAVDLTMGMAVDAAINGAFEKEIAPQATAGFHFEFPVKKEEPSQEKKE
jgi:hypothetical protein